MEEKSEGICRDQGSDGFLEVTTAGLAKHDVLDAVGYGARPGLAPF